MSLVLRWSQSWDGSDFTWLQTWGEGDGGALEIAATGSVGFGGLMLNTGALSVLAAAAAEFPNAPRNAAAINVPGSTTVLFEGTTLKVPAAFSFTPAVIFEANSALGSVFSIADNQTEMAPSAGSVPHAAVIAVSSAVPVFLGSNANDFTGFSIAATSSLAFAAIPPNGAEFAIAGTATVSLAGVAIERSELHIINAVSAIPYAALAVNPRAVAWGAQATPIFAPYSQAEGRFGIAATGFVEFAQTAGTVSDRPYSFVATGSLGFTGRSFASGAVTYAAFSSLEFGQPGGGVEFGGLELAHEANLEFGAASVGASSARWAARATLDIRNSNFEVIDDDLKHDSRAEIFRAAAAAEREFVANKRRLAKIAKTDEDDLLILAAALSQAICESHGGVRQ